MRDLARQGLRSQISDLRSQSLLVRDRLHARVFQQRDDAIPPEPDSVTRAPDFVGFDLAAVFQIDNWLAFAGNAGAAGRDWIQTRGRVCRRGAIG